MVKFPGAPVQRRKIPLRVRLAEGVPRHLSLNSGHLGVVRCAVERSSIHLPGPLHMNSASNCLKTRRRDESKRPFPEDGSPSFHQSLGPAMYSSMFRTHRCQSSILSRKARDGIRNAAQKSPADIDTLPVGPVFKSSLIFWRTSVVRIVALGIGARLDRGTTDRGSSFAGYFAFKRSILPSRSCLNCWRDSKVIAQVGSIDLSALVSFPGSRDAI